MIEGMSDVGEWWMGDFNEWMSELFEWMGEITGDWVCSWNSCHE